MTELHSLKGSEGLDWSSSPPNSGNIAPMHTGGHFDGAIGAGGPAAAAPTAPGQPSGGIGSFFSSPFASVGVEYGKTLLKSNPVLNSGVGGWLRGSRLRYYFKVEQKMLLRKVGKILFPFIHYDWARSQAEEQEADVEQASLLAPDAPAAVAAAPLSGFQPPSKDINAPDLYIGCMAFINFVVTMGFALGSVDAFDPESLGLTATRSLVCLLFEVGCIYALFYLHDAPHSPPVLDLLCLCSYKYVALNLDIIVGLLFGSTTFWIVFLALAVSTAIFMIRTLNGWLPSNAAALGTSPSSPRFRTMLAVSAALQLAFSLFLLYPALHAVHSSSGLSGLKALVPAAAPKSSSTESSMPAPATPTPAAPSSQPAKTVPAAPTS